MRRVSCWGLLLGLALHAALLATPCNATITDSDRPIKVLTLNLRCLEDHWKVRKGLVFSGLIDLDPDFIGFQECCREVLNCTGPECADNFRDIHETMNEAFNTTYYFYRADTHMSWNIWQDSARKMIIARTSFPSSPNGTATPLIFATTHLDYKSDQVRSEEALCAVDALERYQEAHGIPRALLVGDFNADVVSPTDQVGPTMEKAGYTDTFRALYSSPGCTFQSNLPDERIDYQWVKPGLKPVKASLQFTKHTTFAVYASDHLGVYAEYQITAHPK
ncbi:hypothetical protein PAPYR_5969 [Paratrimastix pyriformis]|uniref:Endonuclease/exonuclease/phosphatase domain-containing protein n=1 Tax=Paratrimastix pyriformis TaxID=342808 RepID=A0ABQ8UGB3_9EUKA|nr:hypothetical protein PAPYR_5969 [Paratrimastix pyriformis]